MTIINSESEFFDLLEQIHQKKIFSLSHYYSPIDKVGAIGISLGGKKHYSLPLFYPKNPLETTSVIYELFSLLNKEDITVVVNDNFDTTYFLRWSGIYIKSKLECIRLLLHLLNEKPPSVNSPRSGSMEDVDFYVSESAGDTFNHFSKNKRRLNGKLLDLYNLECYLIKILTEMSYWGISTDKTLLGKRFEKFYTEGAVKGTRFDSTTQSGRIYTSNPNIQNIPKSSQVLNAFQVDSEHIWVFFDYSQIELRVLAHYSEDKVLIGAFNAQLDLHETTARIVFDKINGKITKKEREIGKLINFSILYGISCQNLQSNILEKTGLTVNAQELTNAFHATYTEVNTLQKEIVSTLESNKGCVTTLYGRVGKFPEFFLEDEQEKCCAIRRAFNFLIQSTAADLVKTCIGEVFSFLKSKNAQSRMVMCIHDEIIFWFDKKEMNLIPEIQKILENTVKLDNVPLKVNIKLSENNWKDKTDYIYDGQ